MTRGRIDPSGRVGRADLALALRTARSDGDREVLADVVGFELRPVTPHRGGPPRSTETPSYVPDEPTALAPACEVARSPVAFWRVTHRAPEVVSEPSESRTVPATQSQRRLVDFLGPDPEAPLPSPPPPLVPWARLRRAVEQLVGAARPVGDVDVDAVVDRVVRGEPLQRVPRLERRVRAPRIVVVIDRCERLVPFWGDQLDVYWHMREEIGGRTMEHAWWVDGPPEHESDLVLVAAVTRGLEAGDVVLVLGDLGGYGSKAVRRAWIRLGEALGRHGVTAAALVPAAAVRSAAMLRAWQVVAWEAPEGGIERAGRRWEERRRRREQLLAMLSWTRRIEPELLRVARLQLPPDEADVETEADVWNHPRVGRHPAGLLLRAEERAAWRERLSQLLEEPRWRDVLQRVVGEARAWHRPLARELWIDEAREVDGVGGGSWITARERAEVVALTQLLHAHATLPDRERSALGPTIDVLGWARRSLGAQPWERLEGTELGEIMLKTWDAVAPKDERDMPPELAARMLPPKPGAEVRQFVVGQVGGELHVVPEGVEASASRMIPIVTVPARARWLEVGRRAYALDDEGVRRIDLPAGEEIELATDCLEKVRLRLEPKPEWARAMGRDRQGLWVQHGEHRLAWPTWARNVGKDEFGLWATFRVGEVEQRMRWIVPGTFVMGSPREEEGRWSDAEGPQHEVTLTEGYWLADTPCTQALWVAVVGDNPSRFQSLRRPVEQVSWDDVQRFLAKLNERVPGLEVELPTEAQWEHACRAGTATATYAGDLRVRGANDAPLLDDIAWYGGNSGVGFELANGYDSSGWPEKQYPHTRAGTREVGLKRPNPWGLYDMLGNVLEWCGDMPRRYDTQPRTNPVGMKANALGPERVLRGGSWLSSAQCCRAANRDWLDPGFRDGFVGFRLSRGQGLRQQASPASQQQGRKQGRGTSPASPGVRRRKKV